MDARFSAWNAAASGWYLGAMNRYATLGLLLASATACPAEPGTGDTQASTSDTCGTGGCSSLTSSSGPADSSTTLDCGTGGCCVNGPGFCGDTTTTTTADGDSTTDAGDSTTTGPGVEPPCGFLPTLEMLATGKTDPIDCGTLTLDDDAAAWQAASDCAATAAAAQEGFLVAFQRPSDDSLIFEGFYGSVGFAYALGRLYTDTFGDPMFESQACTDVTTLDGCMVDVGVHCLTCAGAGEPMALECTM